MKAAAAVAALLLLGAVVLYLFLRDVDRWMLTLDAETAQARRVRLETDATGDAVGLAGLVRAAAPPDVPGRSLNVRLHAAWRRSRARWGFPPWQTTSFAEDSGVYTLLRAEDGWRVLLDRRLLERVPERERALERFVERLREFDGDRLLRGLAGS